MMEEEQNSNEHEFHLSFMISGFYLLMVGFTGALFNIIALMKASQVGQMPYYYDNNRENIILPAIEYDKSFYSFVHRLNELNSI